MFHCGIGIVAQVSGFDLSSVLLSGCRAVMTTASGKTGKELIAAVKRIGDVDPGDVVGTQLQRASQFLREHETTSVSDSTHVGI